MSKNRKERQKNGRFAIGNKAAANRTRSDGWANVLTGMSTIAKDKRLSTGFAVDEITIPVARDLWRGDDLAARIIETVPNEMLREGFEFRIGGDDASPDLISEIQDDWETLELGENLWKAATFERAYGGGAVLLGADDGGELSDPLEIDRVRSFDWITALEPDELLPHKYFANPAAPKFGKVATYLLTARTPGPSVDPMEVNITSLEVHESRLLVFPGIRVSRHRFAQSAWGDNVLTRIIRVLRDYNVSWDAAAILIHDFSQAIFKVKGLAEMIAMDKGELLKNRAMAVELSRSVARAIMIDEGEEFERKQTPITGLPEMLDKFSMRLAAAADMPVTLLMGQSPAGLNATGESDIRFFYDRIRSWQQKKLKPHIQRVIELQLQVRGQAPEQWSVAFAPLWQPTEQEIANARKTQAETDEKYINTSVLSADEVARSRFAGDEYSFETQIDFDDRSELEADKMAAAQEREAQLANLQALNEKDEGDPPDREDRFDISADPGGTFSVINTRTGEVISETPSRDAAEYAIKVLERG